MDIDRIFTMFQSELRGVVSASATDALRRLKSPSFWGSTVSGRKYAALHSGRLYRAITLLPARINGDDIVVGIGDLGTLEGIQPLSFQVMLHGKSYRSRDSGKRFSYWRAIEFGVSPSTGKHFVPVALSPWSRSRSKGRGSGMSFSLSGKARISGFVGKDSLGRSRRLGGEDQRRGKQLVPIAQSGEFNAQRKAGTARLPFRQGEKGTGRFSRFYSNMAAGFMADGGSHPGVRPTYMFRRTSLYLRQILNARLDGAITAFSNNIQRYIQLALIGAMRDAD